MLQHRYPEEVKRDAQEVEMQRLRRVTPWPECNNICGGFAAKWDCRAICKHKFGGAND